MKKIIEIYNVLDKNGKTLRDKINIDIIPWNKCNNNCLMCTNPLYIRFKKWLDLEEILRILELKMKMHNYNTDMIENIGLTGGEPTLAPCFFELLLYLRKRFPQTEINLLTNGRRFCSGLFAQKCLHYIDKLNIILSLHAHKARLHYSITQAKGAFQETLQGIKNILTYKNNSQHLEIRVVITKLNYKYLDEILGFLIENFKEADRIVFIFMEYEGQVKNNLDLVAVRYENVNNKIRDIKNMISRFKEVRLYHFPLCIIGPEFWKYTWRTLPQREVMFLEKCNACPYKEYCLGIPKDYIKANGIQEFKPPKYKYSIERTNNFYKPISSVNCYA